MSQQLGETLGEGQCERLRETLGEMLCKRLGEKLDPNKCDSRELEFVAAFKSCRRPCLSLNDIITD